jgi:prepilin-type N-terminal cleavage/methylation domain-containing protein
VKLLLKKNKQKGFTLIEFACAMIIIVILSAVALSKFADFSEDSKKIALKNLSGSLNTSLGIVKAKFVAQASSGNTVNLEGKIIEVDSMGNPKYINMELSTDFCNKLIHGLLDISKNSAQQLIIDSDKENNSYCYLNLSVDSNYKVILIPTVKGEVKAITSF